LGVLEKDVSLLKLASETRLSKNTRPKMIITTNIRSLRDPSKLFSRMPHFRDMLCKRHEKVLAAIASPTILFAVAVAPAAWSAATAKATEFVAVFPNTRKETPNTHVARYLGTLRK
jgi:hypothetical protein